MALLTVNLVNVEGKSKHRGISHEQVCVLVARDRTKATVSKVACMGRIVKTKVDNMIGSKLTSDNVLVTDAWRAYKTYAKEKGLEHELNQMMANTLLKVYTIFKMSMVSILV